MEKIFDLESIDELNHFLKSSEESKTYKFLFEEFKNLVEYKNADEWNKLVRICEAFSIIGWKKLERVDAICFKIMNTWKTELRNKNKELRFLSAFWTKQKNGFTYFNPSYHLSPDIPEKKSIDWQNYPKFKIEVINVSNLLEQRNKQKVNPITIGGIYSLNTKIDKKILSPLLLELKLRMDKSLNVDSYGDEISTIAIRYFTAKPDENNETTFLKGTYFSKKKEYKAEVFFGNEYVTASELQRKLIIEKLILLTLKDTKQKVAKYKLNYNIDLLINEVKNETYRWIEL